jgi:hypothetical protein
MMREEVQRWRNLEEQPYAEKHNLSNNYFFYSDVQLQIV